VRAEITPRDDVFLQIATRDGWFAAYFDVMNLYTAENVKQSLSLSIIVILLDRHVSTSVQFRTYLLSLSNILWPR